MNSHGVGARAAAARLNRRVQATPRPTWHGVRGERPKWMTDNSAHRLDRIPATSGWLRWGGPTVLLTALLLYVLEYLRWPRMAEQIDVLVYRFGGGRVLSGADLYSVGLMGNSHELLFTYTPFAALCFVPLAVLSPVWVEALSLLLTCVVCIYLVCRMRRWFRVTGTGGWWSLAALLVGLIIWLEPLRYSVELGQINLIILAVVLADVLGSPNRRWAGVGIGLVAAIKLTPVIFILYLALVGRVRAAALAAATLGATVGVGFAVLPADSRFYWLHRHFLQTERIATEPERSFSVRGLILRLHYPGGWGIVAAIALIGVALGLGAIAYRRGQAGLGIAIVGMGSAAASPFSWSHHWVWLAPLAMHLGVRGYVLGSRWAAWALWLVCLLCGGWVVRVYDRLPKSGLILLRPGGIWNAFIPGGYVFLFISVIMCSGVWLWRSPSPAMTASAPQGGGISRTAAENAVLQR
jgi:alpha-1,2-mannosyltransferase